MNFAFAYRRLIAAVLFGIWLTAALCGNVAHGAGVPDWDAGIERIAKRVETGRTGTIEERQLRKRLQSIVTTATEARDAADTEADRVRTLLTALGPKPKEGEEEAPDVRKRRTALETELAKFEGRAKEINVLLTRAKQVGGALEGRARDRLKAQLFERTLTPISYKAWTVAVPEALRLLEATAFEAPRDWWGAIKADHGELEAFIRDLLVALLAAFGGWLAGRWLQRNFGRLHGIEAPSYTRRVIAGMVEGIGRTLGPIVLVILAGNAVHDTASADGAMSDLLKAAGKCLVLFLIGRALINAAMTPKRPHWRWLNLEQAASRRLVHRLKWTLAVFLILDATRAAVGWTSPSAELEAVAALVFAVTMAPLLLSLLDNRVWRRADTSEDPAGRQVLRWRPLIALGLVSLPLIAALGYPGLATYLVQSVVMTGLIVAALLLVRTAGRELIGAAFDAELRVGQAMRETFALADTGARRISFWLGTVLDLCLLVIAGIALLPVWGFSADETAGSIVSLANGIRIGSYTLSLVDIIVGLALFGLVISLTRLLQRGLERHLLPNLSVDRGVRDALKTGVGYVGFVIAGLIGISALGLDLSNLALIAGALSVGLGFGLQNVVNNFVSGLILLVERPIKAGDWVIVGGHEGTVKKVNVRSTEIETFQRASVIIPNADLISTPVVNWTHKDMQGRVEVAVGVAYGSDPHQVEEILLAAAKRHPNVISTPEAFVLFMDFGDSALIFELRAFISDVQKRLSTASELRFTINDALIEAGIEIPFPQRVVHMADGKASLPPKIEPDAAG